MNHPIRTKLGIAAIAGVLFAVGYGLFHLRTGPDESIRTSGMIEAVETDLASEITGRIIDICCKEGDRVEAGQVVIRLQSGDLEAAVAQAEAGAERAKKAVQVALSSVEYSKANLKSALDDVQVSLADVEKAAAQVAEAERKLDRYRGLHAEKIVSQDALDDVETAHAAAAADYAGAKSQLEAKQGMTAAARAQLDTAEKQLPLATADVEQANAALAYSRAKLAQATVTSPLSGTVVFRAREEGETVSPGVTILTIDDLSSIYARVDIDETLIDRVVLGGDATVTTTGNSGKVFRGRVSEVGRYAEFATEKDVTGGRQDIKTFRVKIAIDDPAGFLKPGMTVEVEIPKGAPNDRDSQGG